MTKEKYISPRIKILLSAQDKLLAASVDTHDEYSGDEQLGKEDNWDWDDEKADPMSSYEDEGE